MGGSEEYSGTGDMTIDRCDAVVSESTHLGLKNSFIFHDVDERTLDKIHSIAVTRTFPKKSLIYSQYDPTNHVYLIEQGVVRINSTNEYGEETILRILTKGDVFGLFFFTHDKRPFSAQAHSDVVLRSFEKSVFHDLLLLDSRISINFIKYLTKRLLDIEHAYRNFCHSWSYHRLARLFLKLSDEVGVNSGNGTIITTRFTHSDIANLIGTSRETVTKQLHKLESMGVIQRKGKSFIIYEDLLREIIS